MPWQQPRWHHTQRVNEQPTPAQSSTQRSPMSGKQQRLRNRLGACIGSVMEGRSLPVLDGYDVID